MNRRQALGVIGTLTATVLSGRPGLVWAESADAMAAKALDILEAGDTARALEILARAQARDPRNDRVQALLGRAYAKKGDVRRALEHFQRAVRLNPEDTLSRMMTETIRQFPVPGRGASEGGRAPARASASLVEQARTERQVLLERGMAPRRPGPFRLLLDPGHGGSDPGAVVEGLREADVSLDLALRLARLLAADRDAVTFSLTRTADVHLPDWSRAALAAFYDADVLVSLHATRLDDPATSGLAVYSLASVPDGGAARAVAVAENTGYGRPADFWGRGGETVFVDAVRLAAGSARTRQSALWARTLAKAVPASSPIAPRPSGAAPLRLLAEARTPALVVETGFLSNAGDRQVLAAADRRQDLARVLAGAVMALVAAHREAGGEKTPAPREAR